MIKALVVVVQVIWTVCVVGAVTVIGVLVGLGLYGWFGAVGFGTIGFGLGALLAAHPEVLLELLAAM